MKKTIFLLSVILLVTVFTSCSKDDDNGVQGVEFTNAKLESLVRDALGKPSEAISEKDLLTIDTLNAGLQLTSLNEVEKLTNLVYLNIVDNENINENDIDELTSVLTNCTVLHRKYILSDGKYFILETIEVEQNELSRFPEFEYRILMNGSTSDISAEIVVYSKSLSLVESTFVSDTYVANANFEDHTYHKYWSEINVKDILSVDLSENEPEVKVYALTTGAFTLTIEGEPKVVYHTDRMTY